MVMITEHPIDISVVLRDVQSPLAGGIDMFAGAVRNQSRGRRVRAIEYSAYTPMAEKMLADIEAELRRKWVLQKVVLVHRTGTLHVGEVSVVTAVSAAHRAGAFEACRYAIDRIKEIVPIWKKEIFEEGQAWVAGQHDVDYVQGE